MGIVASRIVERFYRPAILLSSLEEDLAKGSGRSIENFHLFNALVECEGLLERFGGHSRACGLSIKRDSIDNFRNAINDYAFRMILPEHLAPTIDIEAEIPLSLLNEGLINRIEQLSPFGPENPKPVFTTKAVSIKGRTKTVGKNTLKLWVSDGAITCEAVGFKMADAFCMDQIPAAIDIVYTATLDEWQGTTSIELNLKDLRENNELTRVH
jgi:single-stranded-DNA-specific exonuclease